MAKIINEALIRRNRGPEGDWRTMAAPARGRKGAAGHAISL